MGHRIEVSSTIPDARAEQKRVELERAGLQVEGVHISDVYTIDADLSSDQPERVAEMLSNPVFQDSVVNQTRAPENFDYAVEIGFHPGVTDNVGTTAQEGVEDLLGTSFTNRTVYSSQLFFLSGDLTREDAQRVGTLSANPLIQRVQVKSREEYDTDNGMGITIPMVKLDEDPRVSIVDVLSVDDLELQRIGKMGIFDHNRSLTAEEYGQLRATYHNDSLNFGDLFEADGGFFQKIRRGPLALDLICMKAIQENARREDRNPTDVEVERTGQTWSEHCKHTKFADPIDDIEEGLFNRYIRGATERIRKAKGDDDFCVSVFTDNAGIIRFDKDNNITLKAETHNSPSALDPYGGAGTGIVGVNRDPMGTGLGSRPFLNISGPFCFADPNDQTFLYKGPNFTQKMLSSRQIHDGVVKGVNVGGNCSGIPTSHFRNVFDSRYKGKPLVFVGTFGVMPRISAGRPSHEKAARPGDYIVMVGGRVGKDGIHGATFSSEAMDSGSPSTAVQIMDPITQKKMSDALIKEARDRCLYTSITDNGAGGLSCSVNEMAKESGGCEYHLDRVPQKYPGLRPDEIDISESQERMTLSVPPENWQEFSGLMTSRGVEATVIGTFTDSGRSVTYFDGIKVADLDMDFLHGGVPQRPMTTTFQRGEYEEPDFEEPADLTATLHSMLGRQNIASLEFIAQQFDHEVQGGSVVKPLQGKGRVLGNATVTKPVLGSQKGVAVAQGVNPSYSDIDTYDMAACAIDSAIRGIISVGGSLDRIALLDNFCWCSSDDPERLGQLKRACEACFDYSVAYGTPFVSGKDSMFNEFNGFDENGNPVKVSVPPTLTVTAAGVMDNVNNSVTLDAKIKGDLVYVLGETKEELGGSEYFAMKGEQERGERYIGNNVPQVDWSINKNRYENFARAVEEGLVASAQSVDIGGLGVSLAKTSIGGKLGMEIDSKALFSRSARQDYSLFSESQGRLVVTIDPQNRERFEKVMGRSMCSQVGVIRGDNQFIIKEGDREVVRTTVDDLADSYKATFKDY